MGTVLLVLVVVLVVAALIFGVVSLLTGEDPGLGAAEPDGRAAPLPNNRSLTEDDIKTVRFDVTWRGYRMSQVDRILRRTAYDIGYKNEMIAVLEAEVIALREGRAEDADLLRKAREAAANTNPTAPPTYSTSVLAAGWEDPEDELDADDLVVEADEDEPAEEAVDEEEAAADVLDPTAPGRLAYRANGQAATNGQKPSAGEAPPVDEADAVAEPAPAPAAETAPTAEDEDEVVDEDARDASDTPSARA
jgi:DivIVA domain-containing protein